MFWSTVNPRSGKSDLECVWCGKTGRVHVVGFGSGGMVWYERSQAFQSDNLWSRLRLKTADVYVPPKRDSRGRRELEMKGCETDAICDGCG